MERVAATNLMSHDTLASLTNNSAFPGPLFFSNIFFFPRASVLIIAVDLCLSFHLSCLWFFSLSFSSGTENGRTEGMPDSHNAATQSSGLTLLLECVFFLGASFLFSVITWPAQKYINLNKQTRKKEKEENGEKQKMWEKKPVRLIQFISERNFVYLRCFLFQADLLRCCKCRKCCLRKCTTKAYRTGQRSSGWTGGGQGDGREG